MQKIDQSRDACRGRLLDGAAVAFLFVLTYQDLEEANEIHNDEPQGLSSSIFTNDGREAETFLSAEGSDCGIANVNIGPSGAEIGGSVMFLGPQKLRERIYRVIDETESFLILVNYAWAVTWDND